MAPLHPRVVGPSARVQGRLKETLQVATCRGRTEHVQAVAGIKSRVQSQLRFLVVGPGIRAQRSPPWLGSSVCLHLKNDMSD